mgnify:CR=1 FL=1
MICGGGIFTVSVLLCALALRPSPLMMYFTYGILQGFGQGMIYTTIISTAQKWFPGRTGFASGVIVTANGLFGFFMAPFSRALLSSQGIKVTFLVIGVMIGISWIFASIFIKNPENANKAGGNIIHRYDGKQYSSMEMNQDKEILLSSGNHAVRADTILILSPLSQTVQMDRGIASTVAVAAVRQALCSMREHVWHFPQQRIKWAGSSA